MKNMKTFEELNWPEKWKFGKNKGTTQQQVPQNVQPDVKKQKENEINQKLKPYRLYATCPYDRNDIGEEKIYVYYGSIDNYNGMFDDNDDVWYATISTFDDVDYAIVRYNENGEENKPIRKKVADIDAALDYLILMKKNLDANMRRRAREYTHESVKIKNVRGLNEGSGDMAACSCNSKKKKNKSVKKMLKKMKWENL